MNNVVGLLLLNVPSGGQRASWRHRDGKSGRKEMCQL